MELVMLAFLGAAAGLLAGLTGLAGGIVIVPALTWIYGTQALHGAIVVSWFCVFSNSLGAAVRQWTDRCPEQRRALLLSTRWYLLGAALVSGVAAFCAGDYRSSVTPPLVGVLQLGLVAALLLPAAAERRRRRLPAGDLALGAVVGGLSTVTGTGGASYTIAYLVCAAGVQLRDAIAAATLVGTTIGGLAVIGYLLSLGMLADAGEPLWCGPMPAVGLMALVAGGMVTASCGVRVGQRVSTRLLRHLITASLGLSAVRLVLS